MQSHSIKLELSLGSHFKGSLPEQISQSSSGSSGSIISPSSTSSRKQVTWGKSTTAKNPIFPAAHRRVHSTLDYLKHRLRQVESERSIGPLFKRRQTGAHEPLQGILKPPTAHFPEDQSDLRFDWTEFQDELAIYATDSLAPPPLDTPSDITEDTPTESMTSTPPELISPCDSWDTGSEYWSDQWDETPELPSGWSPPPDYLTISQMEVEPGPEISEQTKPVQLRHQPVDNVQTPGKFVEEMTSSLQYGLIVCGLGFLGFLFLACWTILLITCGVMIASVFPAVLVTYGFMPLFARTKCSIEWPLMTTLKIGGGLTLAIGIGLVVIVESVGDTAFTLFWKLAGTLPAIVFFGTLLMAFFIQPEGNNNASGVLANDTEHPIY
ncbi:hypothetical protein FRC11_014703 [Ceratobasidium sp. 423]|nr:hypothetical protein FRC11_014703 [Ceratobasidium sp. 423]